jgi:uncharacterized protein YkwD
MLRPFRARATACALAIALATACDESPTAPAVDGASGELALAALTVVGCDGAAVALSADEKRTLELHNETRRAHALPALCVHPLLTAAARAHSREMLALGFLSHDSFDGQPFHARIAGFGYTQPRALAENAGWGSAELGEADTIFARWMASDSHRPNILDGRLREVGIGVAAGTYRTYAGARVYTVDFGTR